MTSSQFSTRFLSAFKAAQNVMISTGAGISNESGVPTFRGPGGLWKDFRPEELATAEAFSRNPKRVWEWYDWRRQLLKSVEPNPGHYAIARLESLVPRLFLFTQNIDGLHQKAGSTRVHELHGNIWRVRCTRERNIFEMADALQEVPPHCECGALLRPDVVWFGESLPEDILRLAWQVAAQCEVFFLIGTSATVQPAASLAWIAKENGAFVVEINPEATAATEIADESFREKSGAILPELVAALENAL